MSYVEQGMKKLILENNLASEAEMEEIFEIMRREQKSFREVILSRGVMEPLTYVHILSYCTGMPFTSLSSVKIQPEVLQTISEEFALKYQILPLFADNGRVKVASNDSIDSTLQQTIYRTTGMRVDPVLTPDDIDKAISYAYSGRWAKYRAILYMRDFKRQREHVYGEYHQPTIVYSLD